MQEVTMEWIRLVLWFVAVLATAGCLAAIRDHWRHHRTREIAIEVGAWLAFAVMVALIDLMLIRPALSSTPSIAL